MSAFQDGACWAMELLKRQLDARAEGLRKLKFEADADTGCILNGLENVMAGIRIQFEIELVKTLAAADKANG